MLWIVINMRWEMSFLEVILIKDIFERLRNWVQDLPSTHAPARSHAISWKITLICCVRALRSEIRQDNWSCQGNLATARPSRSDHVPRSRFGRLAEAVDRGRLVAVEERCQVGGAADDVARRVPHLASIADREEDCIDGHHFVLCISTLSNRYVSHTMCPCIIMFPFINL